MTTVLFLCSFLCSWSATTSSAFVLLVQKGADTFTRLPPSFLPSYNGEESDGDGASSSKSIDEYVMNVHGGKYRFDDPSSIGTAAGRDFVESLYSSSSTDEADIAAAKEAQRAASDYNTWPNWAKRMVTNREMMKASIENVVEVARTSGPSVITIQNQYRTWEPYYARIARFDENNKEADDVNIEADIGPYRIQTIHGKLAPHGGIDAYSDSANIVVQCTQTERAEGEIWFLIVGTEEEQWYYRLI